MAPQQKPSESSNVLLNTASSWVLLQKPWLEFLSQGTEPQTCLLTITKTVLKHTQVFATGKPFFPSGTWKRRKLLSPAGLPSRRYRRGWRAPAKQSGVWNADSGFIMGVSFLGLDGKSGTAGENDVALGTGLITTRESGHHVLLTTLLWIT